MNFKNHITTFSLIVLSLTSPISASPDPVLENSNKLTKEVLSGHAFENLKELTDLGHRLSGSDGAARAVAWAKAKMESYGFDKVWLQPVKVPHWTRGSLEKAQITKLNEVFEIAALGGSIGTSGQPLLAQVVEVGSLDEADKMGLRLKNKIVFFNNKMNPSSPNSFEEYSKNVRVRYRAAAVAGKHGAKAAVIRSLSTLTNDPHPHTGIMRYTDGVQKVPAAALSTRSANRLSELLKHNSTLELEITLSAETLPDANSFNVIGEITGSELPNEYVVAGAHLDSWDLSHGAHDDGAGVVQSIEAGRSLLALGIRPKRTVRVVLFMSEEFGGQGAAAYATRAKNLGEKHTGAIESDSGGFFPKGISVSGDSLVLSTVSQWMPYLKQTGIEWIKAGGSGADVGFIEDALGTPTFGYVPDPTHYFDFHHSALDTINNVNENDLKHGAAVMTVFTYLMSENTVF